MRSISLLLCVSGMLMFSGCLTSSRMLGSKKTESVRGEEEPARQESRKSLKNVNYTFLDTINDGNEILLRDTDFSKSQAEMPGMTASPLSTEALFKVQVFASNSIETIREQKKELEKNTDAAVQIGYEAPYYKLYAGSFARRQEAQAMLAKLKKIGYLDAWIVSTKE